MVKEVILYCQLLRCGCWCFICCDVHIERNKTLLHFIIRAVSLSSRSFLFSHVFLRKSAAQMLVELFWCLFTAYSLAIHNFHFKKHPVIKHNFENRLVILVFQIYSTVILHYF